jgi:agmatinase
VSIKNKKESEETFTKDIEEKNKKMRTLAEGIIKTQDQGLELSEQQHTDLATINKECETVRQWVRTEALRLIQEEKIIGVIGGDHSTSLGLIDALSESIKAFGILQFDAHMDLRDSYQGFKLSHASIMKNALQNKQVTRLVQVGTRDYCFEESEVSRLSKGRIRTFTDIEIKDALFEDKSWQSISRKIVNSLPDHVYISFDIDGLNPSLCPNTGTPVPGGITFEQAMYVIALVQESGRKIMGFDIVEVSPAPHSDWDANVGARVLFHLAGYCLKSLKL